MKRILFTLFLIVPFISNSQFNYQSLLRNSNGTLITNTTLSYKISFIYDLSSGTPIYTETHSLTTPSDGVINLVIGTGTVSKGVFNQIDWSRTIYIKREVDLTGSGTYTDFGSSLLNSVPKSNYSLATQGISFGSNTVSVTNLMVTNTVTATKFVGDGSGLTGINLIEIDSQDNVLIGTSAPNLNSNGVKNIAIGKNSLQSNTSGAGSIAIGNNVLTSVTAQGGNIGIGLSVMPSTTSGYNNVGIGSEALRYNTTGYKNTSLGHYSLRKNTTGNNNTSIGFEALESNTTGSYNTGVGPTTLKNNISGTRNISVGSDASANNTTGSYNTSMGVGALRDNVAGNGSVAIGYQAMMYANEASSAFTTENTAIGYESLMGSSTSANNTGSANTSIGYMSLRNLTSGIGNVSIGKGTMISTTSGYYNTAIGFEALKDNTTGTGNIAIGSGALYQSIDSGYNVAIGQNAGYFVNTSGNVMIGNYAGYYTTSGSENVVIGANVFQNNTTGGKNTLVGGGVGSNIDGGDYNSSFGHQSGLNIIDGNYNTLLGAGADIISTTNLTSPTQVYNSTAIGANAIVNASNTFAFGDSNITKWAFGLSTTDSGNSIQVGDDTTNGNGASLTSAGVWTNASSILFKTNFIELDNEWILKKINSISIKKWKYKNTNETHIGPTSEEFIATFNVGNGLDKSHLGTIDVSGVALRGVQALIDKIEFQKEEIDTLKSELNTLKDLVQTLINNQ